MSSWFAAHDNLEAFAVVGLGGSYPQGCSFVVDVGLWLAHREENKFLDV